MKAETLRDICHELSHSKTQAINPVFIRHVCFYLNQLEGIERFLNPCDFDIDKDIMDEIGTAKEETCFI